MNYQELLLKYLKLIIDLEDSDFLYYASKDDFTEDEMTELKRLAAEAENQLDS